MGKISTFFYSLKRTFTSPPYYADILKAPFSFSLKFFYFFFFVYALLFTLLVTIRVFLPLNDLISALPEKLVEVYPAELEVRIRNGEVSTNVPEPYRIPLEDVKNTLEQSSRRVLGTGTEAMDYFLVIDTQGKIDDFFQYQTYVLLTKNHLSYLNEDGHLETISLTNIDNLTINRKTVESVVGRVVPFLRFIVPGLAVITFFFVLISYPSTKLLYLLFFALVLLVIGKVIKFPLSYSKSYQLGLHLIIVSTAFFSAASLLGLNLRFPFLQTILLSVLGIIILGKIKAGPALPPKTAATKPTTATEA